MNASAACSSQHRCDPHHHHEQQEKSAMTVQSLQRRDHPRVDPAQHHDVQHDR